MDDWVKMFQSGKAPKPEKQSGSEESVADQMGKSKKSLWSCAPLLSKIIDSDPLDHGRSLSSGVAFWKKSSKSGDVYSSALANYMVPRMPASGLASLGNHTLQKVGQHLRCLDRTHDQASCNR